MKKMFLISLYIEIKLKIKRVEGGGGGENKEEDLESWKKLSFERNFVFWD